MTESYTFISDKEPSDEQLEDLMQDVLRDVKEKNTLANEKFNQLKAKLVKEALEKRKLHASK
jgi:hypothetical protein